MKKIVTRRHHHWDMLQFLAVKMECKGGGLRVGIPLPLPLG